MVSTIRLPLVIIGIIFNMYNKRWFFRRNQLNLDKPDGILFIPDNNRIQINEIKRIFARTTNLSKVDSNRWKLTMRKDYSFSKKGNSIVYQLSFYFDNILVDCWAVFIKKQFL